MQKRIGWWLVLRRESFTPMPKAAPPLHMHSMRRSVRAKSLGRLFLDAIITMYRAQTLPTEKHPTFTTALNLPQIWQFRTSLEMHFEERHGFRCIMAGGLAGVK